MSKNDLADRLAADPDGAVVPSRLRAILDYALLLTHRPHDVTAASVAALRTAGLSDAEIHRVASVTAYFAFVNRIAEGLGVELETGADDAKAPETSGSGPASNP